MPEIYDPQKNTFIKKPEAKVCITCGQPILESVKPMSNEMNHYVNPITGNIVTINSAKDMLEIQGVKLYRATGKDSETGKWVSSLIPKVAPEPAKPAVTK